MNLSIPSSSSMVKYGVVGNVCRFYTVKVGLSLPRTK